MSYLNYVLEPGGIYVNRSCGGVKLPHDSDVKDPDKLAKLSGPVIPRRLEDIKSESIGNDNKSVNCR